MSLIFDKWVKEKLTKDPKRKLDQLILNHAKTHMKGRSGFWEHFKIPAIGLGLASLMVFWLAHEVGESFKYKKTELTLTEPIEMIQDYEDMESMVEVASWTDEEWEYALSKDKS